MTTPAFALNIMDFIPDTEWAAIQSYTYPPQYDCYAAVIAAIAALPAATYEQGGVIQFPPGYYRVGQTIQLKRSVRFEGAGGLSAATILAWPSNVPGIVVNDFDTDNDAIAARTTTAGASSFKGLAIWGNGAAEGNTIGSGLRLRARAHIEDCQLASWPENGILIAASVGGDDASRGNANNWSMRGVWANNNGGCGALVYGSDSNAGVAVGFSASSNGKWATLPTPTNAWGVYDGSFLGNSWLGCHSEFNFSGPYKADNQNARSIFLGCYSEQDGSAGSNVSAPSMVIGGLHAAGFVAGMTGQVIADHMTPFNVATKAMGDTAQPVTMNVGLGGTALTLQLDGVAGTTQLAMWHDRYGVWADTYGYGDESLSFMRTTPLTKLADFDNFPTPLPAGQFVMPARHWVYIGGGTAKKVVRTYSADAPTGWAGTPGDIVYNTAPVAGGSVGWICTTGGSPGTWKTFGAIAA